MKQISRVAAIHDMSGLGRCSLTVILPTLSAMGVQCCPMQTAYLSAHTGFPPSEHASFVDLTGSVENTIAHWRELNVNFQAIYSGFLGSAQQLDLLERMAEEWRNPGTLLFVDPVMGDHGKIYRTYTDEMCKKMGDLTQKADVITPNITESAILLGESIEATPKTEGEARAWLERLSLNGKRSVVITGLSWETESVGAGCYDRESDQVNFVMAHKESAQFSGTGDLFASVALGALLGGHSLATAMERAVNFVQSVVAYTVNLNTPVLDGVAFEPLLGQLMLQNLQN